MLIKGGELRTLLGAIFLVLASVSATFANVRIIDGDTFDLRGQTIRLHGIDAPERGQRCKAFSGTWACGEAAEAKLATLLNTSDLECQVLSKDRYGRSIARCLAGGKDVGGALVRDGLAWAFVRFSDDYVQHEAAAKSAARGIWQAKTESPWVFRDRRWTVAAKDAPDGCPIKGNISQNGRIYHTPWSPWYNRTRISVNKGERWFCDEAEALAAGWRAPRY